jgi:hypothetical protein
MYAHAHTGAIYIVGHMCMVLKAVRREVVVQPRSLDANQEAAELALKTA